MSGDRPVISPRLLLHQRPYYISGSIAPVALLHQWSWPERGLLPEWVVERGTGGVDGFRRDEFGVTAGVEPDVPVLAVHDDVVVLAE